MQYFEEYTEGDNHHSHGRTITEADISYTPVKPGISTPTTWMPNSVKNNRSKSELRTGH